MTENTENEIHSPAKDKLPPDSIHAFISKTKSILNFMRMLLSLFIIAIISMAEPSFASPVNGIEQIEVNESKQWLSYRGESTDKPVVLFVHGGPGAPLMIFSNQFDGTFSKDFIVVHWDQRSSGKSYGPGIHIETFTLDQVARDGLVVVQHLKKKFGRSQVLLVGHSWGTMVGARMTQLAPWEFSAYISVGTVADTQMGDSLRYEGLTERIRTEGDEQDKANVAKLGPPPWKTFEQIMIQSHLMEKFKGNFYSLTSNHVHEAVKKCTQYSKTDWANLDKAMFTIWHQIQPLLSNYRAIDQAPILHVRTVFVQGKFDLATPAQPAMKYFNQVKAPRGKKWVFFERSAHFPMYEEPAQFLELLTHAAE